MKRYHFHSFFRDIFLSESFCITCKTSLQNSARKIKIFQLIYKLEPPTNYCSLHLIQQPTKLLLCSLQKKVYYKAFFYLANGHFKIFLCHMNTTFTQRKHSSFSANCFHLNSSQFGIRKNFATNFLKHYTLNWEPFSKIHQKTRTKANLLQRHLPQV